MNLELDARDIWRFFRRPYHAPKQLQFVVTLDYYSVKLKLSSSYGALHKPSLCSMQVKRYDGSLNTVILIIQIMNLTKQPEGSK